MEKIGENKRENPFKKAALRLGLIFGILSANPAAAGEKLDQLKAKHPELAAELESMEKSADKAAGKTEGSAKQNAEPEKKDAKIIASGE